MVVNGGDGALIQFMILMELVCGELLDRDGYPCQAIFYMKLGMEHVKFWKDQWSGEISLAVCYPELFWVCSNKEASIADLMQFTNGVLHWDLHIVWAIQDWKLESLMTFMDTIYGLGIRGIGENKMC